MTTEERSTQTLLLKGHQALVQAKDEREIVAAAALVAEGASLVRLLYLTLDERGEPSSFTVVASWRQNAVWEHDPLSHQPLPAPHCGILACLETEDEPALFFDQLPTHELKDCLLVGEAASAAAFKLYGAITPEMHPHWHAALLITWDVPRTFSPTHKYQGAVLLDTLAMVVSNLRMRTTINHMNQQLRDRDRQKDAFLHTVSHELRTPLSGIYTLTDAMLAGCSGVLKDEIREDLEVIHQSGQRLLSIINDILDMAAIRAGMVRLQLHPCSPEKLVTESLQAVTTLPLTKPLQFEVHLEPDLPPIWVDCGRIRQVMLNLLSNAVKFTEQGVISVRVWREGERVRFAVRDQGIGIPAAYQEAIFDPFRRLDTESGRRAGGTGLGLPISQRLVELHGGRLTVESEIGTGACFTFFVPVEPGKEGGDAHPVRGGHRDQRACHEQGCPAVGRGLVGGAYRGGGADLTAR